MALVNFEQPDQKFQSIIFSVVSIINKCGDEFLNDFLKQNSAINFDKLNLESIVSNSKDIFIPSCKTDYRVRLRSVYLPTEIILRDHTTGKRLRYSISKEGIVLYISRKGKGFTLNMIDPSEGSRNPAIVIKINNLGGNE